MQHFYDGQIRRYITQTIRVFSNFVVKYGDGTLVRIPVMYGDADRQVASIVRQNSENKINSVPRISVYVNELSLDRTRLSDSSFVGKVHFRERGIQVDPTTERNTYNQSQGRNYTVERVMPTPFKLSMKIDIWAANTDQKLQILEQILVLFNPSLELQTTDNYIDWTSLTTLELFDVHWSSRTVPVGNDSPIEVATLTVNTPIWISPPAKVKHLGVITKIITSFYQDSNTSPSGYIDGLGQDLADSTTSFSVRLTTITTTTSGDFGIQVYNSEVRLMAEKENAIPQDSLLQLPVKQGAAINWQELFDQFPEQYVAGSSRLFLTQSNGSAVVGTILINPLDNTLLNVSWDPDTLTTNTGIDSQGYLDTDVGYDLSGCHRASSPGTFDAIMDPLMTGPNDVKFISRYGALAAGRRYLIIEDIGSNINIDGADAWKSTTNVDFVARANDIIEWSGTQWNVIFDSVQETDTMVWQTNIYTGVQYLWNGVSWVKSFEGEYKAGEWKIEL
jgi:hypothetical protein